MRSAVKCSLLLLVLGLMISTTFAQSLGDVAKKKPERKSSRVITNDDIPSAKLDEPKPEPKMADKAADQEVAPANAPGEKKPDAPATEATSDEKDSPELQALKKELEAMKANIESRQKRTDAYRAKMQKETDDNRRAVQTEVLAAMESDLQDMTADQQKLEQKIADQQNKDKDKGKEKPSDGQ
jgi:predicted RNase H-like nuclease (RuvC/YqgF family)